MVALNTFWVLVQRVCNILMLKNSLKLFDTSMALTGWTSTHSFKSNTKPIYLLQLFDESKNKTAQCISPTILSCARVVAIFKYISLDSKLSVYHCYGLSMELYSNVIVYIYHSIIFLHLTLFDFIHSQAIRNVNWTHSIFEQLDTVLVWSPNRPGLIYLYLRSLIIYGLWPVCMLDGL